MQFVVGLVVDAAPHHGPLNKCTLPLSTHPHPTQHHKPPHPPPPPLRPPTHSQPNPHPLLQSFLGVAFGAEAFLMALHKKHLPLDEMVHWLLYVTMLMVLVFILLEIRFPRAVLLG